MSKKQSFILALTAFLLLLGLTFLVLQGHRQGPFESELGLMRFAYHLQKYPILSGFFSFYTNAFGGKGSALSVLLVLVLLALVLKQRIGAVWFASITGFTLLLNLLIKTGVARLRPETHRLAAFAHESGKSFPSSHSAFGTLVMGCLFLIFLKKMKTVRRKLSFGLLAGLLIVLVMFSRIFVGVHYPSDTLAGFLEGLTVLAASYPFFMYFDRQAELSKKALT